MPRSSKVHYIAPSAISILPNANGTPSDLAVYVARGTKIKVYSPAAGIDMEDTTYQEWSLRGRNRHLAEDSKPYTIYARLSKTEKEDGYLVFAPQRKNAVSGKWGDKYSSVTTDGLSLITKNDGKQARVADPDYWYVRLGEVSLPEDGRRTVTLDTGIVGTDQYNMDWALNPDSQELRVELECTIDSKDAGLSPIVPLGKSLVLTSLLKGKASIVDTLDHWEIARSTGDADSDASWPGTVRASSFADTGIITLTHDKEYGDDFNGTISCVFTVTAWGRPEEAAGTRDGGAGTGTGTGSGTTQYVELASERITVMTQAGNQFLSRILDDAAQGIITFMKGLKSVGDIVASIIKSENYTGTGMADTGYLVTDNWNDSGSSGAVFDYLTIRKKMIINSLEIKETHFSAGDLAQSCANAEIARTDYYAVDDTTGKYTLLGYSDVRVPWVLRGIMAVRRKLFAGYTGKLPVAFGHWKKVRMTLTAEQLPQVNRVRCYFLAKDGERDVENWWRVNDLARCQTWNVTKAQRQTFTPNLDDHAGNVYWWRKVMKVSQNTGLPRYILKDNSTGEPKDYDPRYPATNTTTNPNSGSVYKNEGGVPRAVTNGEYASSVPEDRRPAEIDGKTYHWFDVAYDYTAEGGGVTGWCDAMSDIPAAGDKVVQFGNSEDPDRMNVTISEVNGAGNVDAPAIKIYRGIYTFSLQKSWWGGKPCKMKLSPATGYEFYGPHFRFITENGKARVPVERGVWTDIAFERDEYRDKESGYKAPDYSDDKKDASGGFVSRSDGVSPKNYVRKCHYYDRVSHKGSLWLCTMANEAWYWRAVSAVGGFSAGDKVPDATYAGFSASQKEKCEHVRNYTNQEPGEKSADWTRQVAQGAGIKKVEVAYAASKSGTSHPAEGSTDWKTVGKEQGQYATDALAIEATGINDSKHTYGVYLWTRRKTYYEDPNDPDRKPTFEYTVVRWGIDADGIDSINSYYLARLSEDAINSSNDNFPMPNTPAWTAETDPQKKWFDTFDACASANRGVGQMQGWTVWEKTVIQYDEHYDKNGTRDTKADVVNYKSSRIGQDGQIGQEEYYMLAASDDFNTVFGSATPDYSHVGIRWYKQDAPASERWRLSSTTPNVNTSMWSPYMPTYDKTTHGKKIYLWNFEKRIDGQGTEYATRPVCIGNHARGIFGVQELYALSAKGAAESGRKFPSDIKDTGTADKKDWWTDEIYDRAPTEALPYQWNKTVTIYNDSYGTKGGVRKKASDWADVQDVTWDESSCDVFYHVSSVRGTRGEDGSGTEYVYIRTATNESPGTPPSNGKGQVSPNGIAGEVTAYNDTLDDWVPKGWSDNPQGVTHSLPYEWVSERHSSATAGTGGFTGGHKWGPFSEAKVWSKWGYNGQDGDGTEYVFIRTTTNTAPVLLANDGGSTADYQSQEWKPYVDGTGRTDIEKNTDIGGSSAKPRCTDNPKGTTREWPYEWVAKRTMGAPSTATADKGHRDWKSYYECAGSSHKMSLWANYAENAMRLDLSNEMDMVLTDSTGKVEKARTVTTVVTVYDGAKKATGVILNDTVNTLAIGTKADGTPNKPTISGNENTDSYTITWMFAVGDRINATNPVTIDVVYLTYPHSAVFTLAASMGQPIYQLQPTLNSVNFSRTDANALTPDSRPLGLKILKIDGDSTTELSSAPSGYTVRYGTSAMPASKTAGTAWGTSDGTTGITWSSNVMAIANSVTIGDVFIALFYGDVVIDRETVPVLKDGAHGENSVRLDLTNENDSMLYDGQGNRLSQKVTSTAYLYDGAEDVSSKVSKWTVTASGCSLESSSSSPNITVSGMTADNGTVTVQAEYTDGHNQKHTKSAILTLKKLVGVDKYDLDVSPNALVLNTSDGWSAAKTVTVKVMRTPANGGTPAAINPATVSYGVSLSASVGSITGSGTSRTLTITQEQATANEGVTVTLYKTGDTSSVLDRETIPFNKAENGDGIVSVTRKYQLSASGNAPSGKDYPTDIDDTKWETSSPAVTAAKPYLWCQEITDYKYQDDTTRYYCVGARGTNGVDAQDVEYVFARTTTSAAPSVSNNSDYTIGGVTHKVTDDDYKPAVSGAYTIGSDGTPTLSAYATDDPQGVTEKLPYEWIAKRTKGPADATTGKRSWQGYPIGAMKLYATFSESPYTADLDNEMDAVHVSDIGTVTRASGVSTRAMLFKGTVAQRFIIKKVTRYSLNGSGEREHVQEFSAGSTHDSVEVSFVAALNDSRAVKVTYAQGAKMYGMDYYEIAIATDGEAQTFTLTFTVVATTGDVYKVWPTVDGVVSSAVHLSRSAADDSQLVVSGSGSTIFRIGAKYRKTTANGQSSTGEITSFSLPNVDGIYSAMYRLRSLSNGTWGSYKKLGSNLETVSVNTYDAAETVICSNAGDVDNTTIDRETIYFIADGKKGKDGTTPTIKISDDGYWIINGVIVTDGDGNPIKAEGIDGTGVAIKGEVANQAAREALTGMSKGDCYIQSDNRRLYMWDGAVWIDLGEFKGEPGMSSYMHIAYARTLTFTNGVITAVTGFTVDNDGGTYDWMGFCTDNSETDPGRGASSTDVTAANKYKWNYMKGRDGSGVEYIYLLTKKGFTPAIDESGGFPDPVGGHVHNDPSKDEFWPKVSLEGTGGTPDDIYGGTRYWYDDPPASVSYEWPMLWWAKREYSYNESTGKSAWGSFGRVMLHNKWTEDAVRIDLDNENDTMLYTSGGTRVSGEIKSTGYLFDGNTDVSTLSGVTWAIKSSTGCTASIVGRTVHVTAMSAVKGSVEVKATYNGVEYVATLTLKKIVDGDKYDLVITPNAIAYNATTDKPAASTLAIQVWKTTVNSSGGVSRVLSSPPTGYGVYANGEKLTAVSTGTYSYTTDNSAISEVAVKIATGADSADILDAETIPVTKAENGAKGSNGDTPLQAFKWTATDQAPASADMPDGGNLKTWSYTAPNRNAGDKFLWMTQTVKHTAADGTFSYDAWSTPVRISGDKGDPGEDASDREWIYIGATTYSNPYGGTHPKNISRGKIGGQGDWIPKANQYTVDDYVPEGWSDTAIAVDDTTNKYVYTSWRDKANGATTWGDFVDPILWSNWGHQGIDGDGVQYVYKLFDHELNDAERTSNIPTKPTQQTQGEWIPAGWDDDPLAPTVSDPYCYCSTIKKIGGEWADTFDKLGLWSVRSQNAVSGDLDNQGDMIACNADGVVRFEQTITTRLRIYDGGQQVTGGVSTASGYDFALAGNRPDSASISNGVLTVQWTFSAGYNLNGATSFTADIAAEYQGKTYSAVFTLTRINSDAVYMVGPLPTVVSFTMNASGVLVPSSETLDFLLGRSTENGGEKWKFSDSDGKTYNDGITLYPYYRLCTSGAWASGWTKWTQGSPTFSNGSMVIPSGTDISDVELCISTADGTSTAVTDSNIFDREVVPVVKDGAKGPKGDDGDDGKYEQRQYARSRSRIYHDDSNRDTTIGTNGWADSAPDPTETYPYLWQRSRTYDPNTQGATRWGNYICLTGANGPDGQPGATGLWYRYAGEWYNPVTEVTNSESTGWYVNYGGNWWMNVLPAGQTNNNTPDAGVEGWEPMNSTFNYYIARAYFGQYAHLGSFIINGDWMISMLGYAFYSEGEDASHLINENGTINDSTIPGMAYEYFDPNHPNDNSPGQFNFCPNFAVDAWTGKVYMNDAYVRGQIFATGGEIDGQMIVGDSGSNHIKIQPMDGYGAAVEGYHGSDKQFSLGFFGGNPSLYVGGSFYSERTVKLTDDPTDDDSSYVQLTMGYGGIPQVKLYHKETGNKMIIDLDSQGVARIIADSWPTGRNSVGVGGVYMEPSSRVLMVRDS